jgi:hypothetical protein
MTRIEKDVQAKGEMKQMKEEVIKEVRKGGKGGNKKMTCSVIVLLFLVSIAFYFLWILASTGLVSVPLLSKVAYEKLEPTRVVFQAAPVQVVANETFQTAIAHKLQSGNGQILDKEMSLKIKEGSLTATVREIFDQSGLSFFDAKNAQIAVLKNGAFEIYAPVSGVGKETAMSLNLSAQIDDGNVYLEIGELNIGSYKAPKSLVNLMFGAIINNELASLNEDLGSFMKIESILYEKGQVEFKGQLTVEVTN